MSKPVALIIDDDPGFTPAVADLARNEGFDARTADSAEQARRIVRDVTPAIVLVDLILPDGSGLELIRELGREPDTRIIIITGHPSVESAIGALRERIDDYLVKPLDMDRLLTLLRQARDSNGGKAPGTGDGGGTSMRREDRLGPLLGRSPGMQQLFDLLEKVAPTEVTLLVHGETGSGKELVASAVHQLSKRKGRFLALNCAAVPADLLANELFGHERGSFTGADRRHQGYFERAHEGTLFLDEVSEMPVELQSHLLRVLETGAVARLGSDREIRLDVRIVAATNMEPSEAVENRSLREDLYYRLSEFPVRVPPLRERPEDIPLLANHVVEHFNAAQGTQKRLSEGALERLREHTWPGNVRELRHVLQRALILSGDEVRAADLPEDFGRPPDWSGNRLDFHVGASIDDIERRLIFATLDHFGGNKKLTAQTLGISLKTLYNRLNRYRDGESGEKVG